LSLFFPDLPFHQLPMPSNINFKKKSASQEFLDSQQYAISSVLRYERIFGKHFVSTGGIETTKNFSTLLNLKPGQFVLDVGCGIGGSAFHMASEYGVNVHGIDLSKNMIELANKKLKEEQSNFNNAKVTFEICDALIKDFKPNSFDVIYSRDAILHIYDKPALFKRFYKWLKPGGILFISDYCCGDEPHSKDFITYVEQRQYHLLTPTQYGDTIRQAGFEKVIARDRTKDFISILNTELKNFDKVKKDFIKDFSEEDYHHIVEGWEAKLIRCSKGDQRWGTFLAIKSNKSKL